MQKKYIYIRPVGWLGDGGGGGGGGGGVRENNKVELIKSGGGSSKERCKLPHQPPWGSRVDFCNF